MDTFFQDLKYGFRNLMRNPGFTTVAAMALALGIAINTAIFTVVNAVLIQPLPYADPDRLYMMWEQQPQMESSVAYPNFLDWRSENHVFSAMAAFRRDNLNLTGNGDPERLSVRMVSSDFFPLLGVSLAHGRNFNTEEDRPGSEGVVILSNGLWRRRFGSDAGILGRQISMDGLPYTVIGVAPSDFEFGVGADVFVPIGHFYDTERWGRANHPGIYVLGRLKQDTSHQQMESEMESIAAGLAAKYPESNHGAGIAIQSLRENVVGDVRPSLLLLTGAVAFVLLIACANVASMMLARASERTREIAIRASLGAGRLRLLRQMLTESLLLASIAAALGILMAYWGVDLLLALRPDSLPKLNEIGMNGQVLTFTLGLTLLTALGMGILPAWKSARPALVTALKDAAAQQSGSHGQRRLRQVLVASEIALALILLIAAGLLTRSFLSTRWIDPGFRPENVLSLQLSLPAEKYKGSRVFNFFDQLEQATLATPGMRNIGYSNGLPFAGASEGVFFIEGKPAPPLLMAPQAVLYVVSPGYFQTMGIQLVKGRLFTADDNASSRMVALIDEPLAQRYFPGEDPLGKRISMGHHAPYSEIVGIVRHVRHYGLDYAGPIQSEMYYPIRQVPEHYLPFILSGLSVVVRTEGEPLHMVPAMRKILRDIDPDQPLYHVQPMEQWLADSLASRKFALSLVSLFAGMALFLALLGVYGVMSYSVVQQTKEIGIRVSLGARGSDILRLMFRQSLLPVAAGVFVGLAGAMGASRWISGMLFHVTPRDPATFSSISLLLLAVAALASYIPARRALKVDPITALKYE